ncbi:DUF1868 domain-containing protein [Paracoccus sp. S1E-3]|uniref:DUF1868 domain-containing protein n=1 Tax=Paracoccus sp. S1E-3 TaxID=2756130 RepID=UPI0015EF8320|nr:DUF1868 domain-containing protein [Paracoccus sp. S1E-3]MBA4489366.1 DUF1868 domain-containing protein [Paracoccus sp. S1E-3]
MPSPPPTLSDRTPPQKQGAPVGVGTKFAPNGHALTYRGNTILCRLPARHPLYEWVAGFLDDLRDSPVAGKLALLPAPSLHMTILGIANDAMRSPGEWPTDLATNTAMDDCDDHIRRRLADFRDRGAMHFDMRLGDLVIDSAALSFHLIPSAASDELRMRGLRDDLATHFQVRRANHDRFDFHLGIAYLLEWLTLADQEVLGDVLALAATRLTPNAMTVRFPAPELCSFETMLEYRTLAALHEVAA